jgi:Family of unknown function (DUF695)
VVEKNEGWTIFAVEVEGGEKRLYRIRLEPPTSVVASEYPNCIIVEWNFEDALPDKPLSDAHNAFEAHMEPLGHNNRNSVLMHVYTKPGMKEWCYYARDYPAFMKELNTALAGKPRFPIEILHDTDPGWKYWTSVRDLVQSAPGV